MEERQKNEALETAERRRFLSLTLKGGATAAIMALAGGALKSREASAQVVQEEQTRKAAAQYTMIVATAYVLGVSRSYPIMQLDFKENIQNLSDGKIYVQLAPGGQLGSSGALARQVQKGVIAAAQCSFSNFSPFVPAVDLINIPYWCSLNQQFVNLVTSEAWKQQVETQIEARGFKPLWYPCIDPRTIALAKDFKWSVQTPEQMAGIKFRIPESKILQMVYRQLGADPMRVPWVEAAAALKMGHATALDPSVEALYVFGFKDILSSVTFNAAVSDSQIYFCNRDWFNGLPATLREALLFACEITQRQNLAKVPAARAHALSQMARAGVRFYTPTVAEKALWRAKIGAQLPLWNETKDKLAGSIANFDRLQEAANSPSGYYVHDVDAAN